jgi:alanyl-tRNA synthetase
MTQRLFFQHDLLQYPVQVLHCTPHEHEFVVELQATIFHPQGGGQPWDTGWIGDSQVLRVLQDGERVLHYVSQAVEPGLLTAHVDAARRLFNSRMHSAGHLIGHCVQTLGWTPIKAHHWPGEGKVSFKPGDDPQPVDIEQVQQRLDQWIAEDLERQISLDIGLRQIGFGSLPAYGCGGTHVRSLLELGQVRITSITQKKGVLAVLYDLD